MRPSTAALGTKTKWRDVQAFSPRALIRHHRSDLARRFNGLFGAILEFEPATRNKGNELRVA